LVSNLKSSKAASPKPAKRDRSTLRLSEVARHLVIPEGIVDTLWPLVKNRCAEFGDFFDPWQDGLGALALGIDAEGIFAATVGGIVISIPRQVAKTFLISRIVIALATLYPNMTILWTAHRTRTADQTFQELAGIVKRPGVKKYLKAGRNNGIRAANGQQEIAFANGSVIMFGAREQGFGRGFTKVDIEIFDEAQILSSAALEDMVPAANHSQFPHKALLFFMGTPPRPKDPGEEFSARRLAALDAKADSPGPIVVTGDALYVEMSADDNVGEVGGPALDDIAQIEKANPSFPHRTPLVSIKRMRKNLTDDASWRREALGVWDGDGVKLWQIVPKTTWDNLAVTPEDAPQTGDIAFGVKFSVDGMRVGVGVAIRAQPGDPVHIEALGISRIDEGLASLIDWLAEPARYTGTRIVIDGKSGADDLQNALIAAGVPKRIVTVAKPGDAISAHSAMTRAFAEGTITHIDQPGLNQAVEIAQRRPIGTLGGYGWQAATEGGDVTALDAVTLALGDLYSNRKRRYTRKAVF